MFAGMPTDPLEALAWLRAKVAHVDEASRAVRKAHDASRDSAERDGLARELMTALWVRGTALERANEILLDLAPEREDQLREHIKNARANRRSPGRHCGATRRRIEPAREPRPGPETTKPAP